jgi:hypothetical protein
MQIPEIIGREKELLAFMKQHGYPVYHNANLFLRDIQYGVRDFFRSTLRRDIGSRNSDAQAAKIIRHMESIGALKRFSDSVWILQMPEFLNPPKADEKKAETTAA